MIKPMEQCRGQWTLLLVAAMALLGASGLTAAEYTLTNLRLLSGDTVGDIHPYTAGGINNLGQVTGFGFLVQDRNVGDDHTSHPVFYDPATGHFVNLGDMDGGFGESGKGGNGYAISDTGWVTGRNYIYDPVEEKNLYRAFYWKDLNGNGQTDPGEMNNLGVESPYVASTGEGLNNLGQVVGRESLYDPVTETRGWLWTDTNGNHALDAGEKTILGDYIPNDINDAGQIVMKAGDHVYRWQDGNSDGSVDGDELVSIPNTAGGAEETVRCINEAGAVAGYMENNLDKRQGFYWSDSNSDGTATGDEIEVFGATNQHTYPFGLNEQGQIVGGTYTWRYVGDKGSERRAFIWDEASGIRDLNDLIDEYSIEGHGPFILSQAYGINDQGQIVVLGHFEDPDSWNNQDHMILLTPVAGMPGDFDGDGDVDGADLLLWQRDGSAGDLADWRNGFGTAGIGAAAVPEPSGLWLLLAGCGLLATRGTRRR